MTWLEPTEAPSPFAGTARVASVGPAAPSVVLVEGQTFSLSDRAGDMWGELPHGLFVLDTRVVSGWELRIDGYAVEGLAADVTEPYVATFAGRGHPAAGHADADLVVFRERSIGAGMRERILVTNHGIAATRVVVELRCESDFADLFEVKECRVAARPRPSTVAEGVVRFADSSRSVEKRVDVCGADPSSLAPGLLTWEVELAAGDTWETCVDVTVSQGGEAIEPRFSCASGTGTTTPARRLASWRASLPDVSTDSADFAAAIHQGGEDLGALRIFDPERPDLPILAAGAPWFMTVFGRDSLLTAWMALVADPSLACSVLETLARFQGTDVNHRTEEEPGKILHEMRFGAAKGFALHAGDIYYGSIDSTPLFLMLMGELQRWGCADDALTALLPAADRALSWLDEHGDRDGDGFVEYGRLNEQGLVNQGWKDSWDAIRHPDGSLASGPIAVCEVQGYAYAARLAHADLAEARGDHDTAIRDRNTAAQLRRRFNDEFWLDDAGWYALALDGDKQPVSALTSNIGHCLWTGIVDDERAPLVADRLLSEDMFSGWGIRTLSADTHGYNPVSYHNGSVWPHDNAICAAGLARYGFVEEAHRVISGQLAVATRFGGRLPELFSGFPRGRPATPAVYPTSCSPQAWAAASPLLWLRVLLGLEPDAQRLVVGVDPHLPPWMRRLAVDGIGAAGEQLSIAVDGEDVHVRLGGRLRVERGTRQD